MERYSDFEKWTTGIGNNMNKSENDFTLGKTPGKKSI